MNFGTNFGSTAAKPFNFSTTTNANAQPLFGNTNQQQPNISNFGTTGQPQQNSNPFGTSTQPSIFNQSNQQQSGQFNQNNSLQQGWASSQNTQQQGGPFGQSSQQQQPPAETLQYGSHSRLEQSENTGRQFWQEGRGLSVYRSIPAQLKSVRDKWNPNDFSSPFRAYLYQNVEKEEEAVKYQPGNDEDEKEWEKAVERRPGPTYVPALCKGFMGLGKRAQLHMEWIHKCQQRLQEINSSLEVQLDKHRQSHATRLAESRRRHELIGRRTLALAVKVQILRNKGYVMDNAEEELKEKLMKLEREVFDPSLNGREQEIWARMLEIRERAKRLRQDMEKVAPTANSDEPVLDEVTQAKAKTALEDYDKQLQYLRQQLEVVQQKFADFEKASKSEAAGGFSRR